MLMLKVGLVIRSGFATCDHTMDIPLRGTDLSPKEGKQPQSLFMKNLIMTLDNSTLSPSLSLKRLKSNENQ